MTDSEAGETLKHRVETWMAGQMPIIEMHGGESAVRKADPDSGEVVVELGGACAGCGISNITAENIRADLIRDFDAVTDVTVRVPSTGEVGSETVEGGRGGELQFSTESAEHF
jgi:Fe-S cluster biogenesis protein NfuA